MNLAYVNTPYPLYELKEYQPYNFLRTFIETAESINSFNIFKNAQRSNFSTFLFLIKMKTKAYIANKPISINVYCEDELYFAENENIAVCGTGNNSEDAIEDLKKHIIHFYEYYKKMDKNKLMGEALRLKDIYADLFIE